MEHRKEIEGAISIPTTLAFFGTIAWLMSHAHQLDELDTRHSDPVPEAVRHERGRRRATRGNGRARFPGEVQDILDNQEDRLEAREGDGIQSVIQALLPE